MKHYTPLRIKPNSSQLRDFLKDQTLSEAAQQSAAYRAVEHVFSVAESLWRALNFQTTENLAVFVDAGKYLTPTQEHDLVSLTASYIQALNSTSLNLIIADDSSITDEERAVLRSALKLFSETASATAIALGNPRWVEPDC